MIIENPSSDRKLIYQKDFPDIIKDQISLYYIASAERAFGNIKDGFKPVVRRILYCMWSEKLTYFKKLAYISGLTMGYLHPYNDKSISDSAVLIGQPFTTNYPYLDYSGNIGAETGDPAAAGRYLEMKLGQFAMDVITDEIDNYSVDYTDNYDNTRKEPEYLPTKLPLILLQGCFGIGEGFIVSIMPHNLSDVVKMVSKYIDNKYISLKELVKGVYPDFPTGGAIINKEDIEKYYSLEVDELKKLQEKEKRNFTIKYQAKIEIDKEKDIIVIKDLPYGVTFDKIEDKILREVTEYKNPVFSNIINFGSHRNKEKKLEFEIICKKDSNLLEITNALYEKTSLRTSSTLSIVMNTGSSLSQMTIKDIIKEWYNVRVQTKRRKYNYELTDTQNKVHILYGLKTIYTYKQEIINLVLASKDKNEAINVLTKKYSLSLVQAKGICEMQIGQLTRLSEDKLNEDIEKHNKTIEKLENNLENIDLIILEELKELEKKYGRPRKTEIIELKQKENKTSIHISNGAILWTRNSIGIFDSSHLVNGKIIMNNLKSVKHNGKLIKEVIGYHPVTKDIIGALVISSDNNIKRLKISDISISNTWIIINEDNNPIISVIPLYEEESGYIAILSKDMKIRKIDSKDINRECNIGETECAIHVEEEELILLYNENNEYLYLDMEEIPTLSKSSQGNNTTFTPGTIVRMYGIKVTYDAISICYEDKGNPYLFAIAVNDLNVLHRTNKPKLFHKDLKGYKLLGCAPVSYIDKANSVMVYISSNSTNIVKCKLLKANMAPKKLSIKPFGAIQIST
jgi:DNA gyrase/topoisomerase IV subunit A